MATRNRSRAIALALFIFGGCFITPYPRQNGRVKSSVTRRAEMEAEDQTDILAKALAGGPPLRIGEKGLEFELGKGAEGSSVKWGLLKERTPEVDQSAKARERRAELRAKAARDLVNIDDEERERRRVASYAFAAFAALLALYLLWSNAPWYSRGALFPVVALAWGYNLSAKEGL